MLKKIFKHQIKNEDFILTSKLRMIVYLTAIMFGVFIAMNAVFSKMYSENVKQIVLREFSNKVEQTSRYMELIAEKVETTSEIVLTNSLVQNQALEELTGTPSEVLNRRDLITFLQSVTFTIEEANSIDLYFNRAGIFITSAQGAYSKLDPKLVYWYYELEKNNEISWIVNYGKMVRFLRDRPPEQITLIRPLVSIISGQKLGLIAINLEKRVIMNLFSSDVDANNILVSQSGAILLASLMDGYDYQSVNRDLKIMREAVHNGKHFYRFKGVNHVVVSRNSPTTGLEIISFAPIKPSLTKISRMSNYVLLFLLANFIVLLFWILVISRRMFDPVNKLIRFMKKVEQGNLNVIIEDHRKDEFGYIYHNFNRMVANIRSLFQELYEEKLLKKDAELKLLQSKVNPHFIYNIFNNMNWLLELERYGDLREMMEAVAVFYKTSLNSGNDFIKISDNITQLESYAKIQMIRFKNKFRCDFKIDSKIQGIKIPIFILQPLLENAICHGVEPKKDNGIIRVTVKARKDRIFFAVEDNGIGIEKVKLKEIRESLKDETLNNDHNFALVNINKRIKIYYGREYSLKIISKTGYGTKVSFTIPLLAEIGEKNGL